MKFFSVVTLFIVACMAIPETNAYLLRCSTFDGYKRDMGRWFSYRDGRINSLNGYLSAIANKVCFTYTVVNKFKSTNSKMDALMKAQAGINARLYRDVLDLYKENKELEEMLDHIRKMVKSAESKNNDQDAVIGSIRSHNSKQDSRMGALESKNNQQRDQITSILDRNSAQQSQLDAVKLVNAAQDSSLVESADSDTKQDAALAVSSAKNQAQDVALKAARVADEAQKALLDRMAEKNAEQQKNIDKVQYAVANIRDLTIKLVNKLLADFASGMNRSVFAKDMFITMLNTYI